MIKVFEYLKDKKKIQVIVGFLILIFLAWIARFYNLAAYGLGTCDAFIYTSVAKQWYFDHLFVNPWAKPGYHLLSYLGIRLFGFYDFMLLYLNSLLDLCNIILLILIGFKIGLRRIFIFSAAIIYAFLPSILQESTRGLPHLPSTVFFLAAFYVFLIYFNSNHKSKWFLFLIGFLSVFAGNVHPTLLCGIVFYGIVFVTLLIKKQFMLTDFFVYVLGGISVFIGFAILMAQQSNGFFAAFQEIVQTLFHHRQIATQGNSGGFLSQLGYSLSGLTHSITVPFSIFLIFTVIAISLIRKMQDTDLSDMKLFDLIFLWGVVANFLLINCFTVLAWQYRFLVPVVPLIILGLCGLIDFFVRGTSKEHSINQMFFIGAVVISLCNVSWNWDVVTKKTPTVYRQMANVLYDKVNDENRLLISPSFFFAPTFYLEEVYFDGDNLYRAKGPWIPKLNVLQAYNIKYVAIAKDLNTDDKKKNGFFPSDIQGKSEYFSMYYGLHEIKAKLLYDSEKVSIFELPINGVSGVAHKVPLGMPFFNVGHDFNKGHPLYTVRIK